MRQAAYARRIRAALGAGFRRFVENRNGIAAIEFAVVLPIMLTIYFGLVEVGQAVMANRKVTALNRALADLAGQAASISNADMSNIFDAATTIMLPFTDAAPAMSIVHVVIDDTGAARVCWSDQRNSAAPARGSSFTVPANLLAPNSSLIVANASYTYTPTLGYVVTGPITLKSDTVYMRPRAGKTGGLLNIQQVERVGLAMCTPYS